MGLRLTLRYLRCKSVARVHASIHRYVGTHRIASFQPRNGSPRLHVLITQYAPLLQYNLVHPPWYPVLCLGVVGVYTVRHGPRRSILCIYGPGQRIWPAMKRISSPAHTFLHGGCHAVTYTPHSHAEYWSVRSHMCGPRASQHSPMTHAEVKYRNGPVRNNVTRSDVLIHRIFHD
jgi:hypothetical protein